MAEVHPPGNVPPGVVASPVEVDRAQARVLRDAAGIMLLRATKQTLMLRVIVRCLERAATKLEQPLS